MLFKKNKIAPSNTGNRNINLWFLFWNFLKIGSYSFGGYMALVAVIKKEFVERKKIITDEEILDGLSLASFLPGPVAVNTVVYIGFILRGVQGAIVSMAGVLLPTFILVTGFSIYYFKPGKADIINPHILFIMPIVVAIITDVGIKMAKKQLHSLGKAVIALGVFFIILFWSSTWAVLFSLLFSAIAGLLFFQEKQPIDKLSLNTQTFKLKDIAPIITVVLITSLVIILLTLLLKESPRIVVELSSVFSSMSLSLFGGGYVIIPIIKNTIVSDLGWLSSNEFNAAISISQITPGPILISAAFIGYKMAGITGALVGTISIFLPSGLLMILLSGLRQNIKESEKITAILTGLRSAVIGLIMAASFSIGIKTINNNIAIAIFLVSLISLYFTKIHPALIIAFSLIISTFWVF